MVAGVARSIASVFCPPSNRGKGYATLLMRFLSTKFHDDGILASNLYSDIGPTFYTRLGWNAKSSDQCTFEVPSVPPTAAGVIPLETEDQVKAVLAADDNELAHELEATEGTAVYCEPTFEAIEWLWCRSNYFLRHPQGKVPVPPETKMTYGVMVPSQSLEPGSSDQPGKHHPL
jgi:hypothetical protein